MPSKRWLGARCSSAAVLVALLLFVFAGAAFGKKGPKTYPEEGKVVATAVNQVPVTTYHQVGGPNGGSTMPVRSVRLSRTYTVETGTKTYELDCGKHPHMFSTTPGECGGDKKLAIGDVVHFRTEKGFAYIPVPVSVEANGEQKLRILNEDLRQEAKPAENPPDTHSGDGEQKPPGAN